MASLRNFRALLSFRCAIAHHFYRYARILRINRTTFRIAGVVLRRSATASGTAPHSSRTSQQTSGALSLVSQPCFVMFPVPGRQWRCGVVPRPEWCPLGSGWRVSRALNGRGPPSDSPWLGENRLGRRGRRLVPVSGRGRRADAGLRRLAGGGAGQSRGTERGQVSVTPVPRRAAPPTRSRAPCPPLPRAGDLRYRPSGFLSCHVLRDGGPRPFRARETRQPLPQGAPSPARTARREPFTQRQRQKAVSTTRALNSASILNASPQAVTHRDEQVTHTRKAVMFRRAASRIRARARLQLLRLRRQRAARGRHGGRSGDARRPAGDPD